MEGHGGVLQGLDKETKGSISRFLSVFSRDLHL